MSIISIAIVFCNNLIRFFSCSTGLVVTFVFVVITNKLTKIKKNAAITVIFFVLLPLNKFFIWIFLPLIHLSHIIKKVYIFIKSVNQLYFFIFLRDTHIPRFCYNYMTKLWYFSYDVTAQKKRSTKHLRLILRYFGYIIITTCKTRGLNLP